MHTGEYNLEPTNGATSRATKVTVGSSDHCMLIRGNPGNCFWSSASMEAFKFEFQISCKFIFLHFKNSEKNTEISEGITHMCKFLEKNTLKRGLDKKKLRLFNT